MTKENKVEYERVDEESDEYRRILAKFNPHFLRGSDFEIEFIPILNSVEVGRVFVSEIDSVSTIGLYRWVNRQTCLTKEGGIWKRGTIPTKGENREFAKHLMDEWRQGEFGLEPRQIISRVKYMYESIAKRFSEPTAFAYCYFVYCGELGSLPIVSDEFSIGELRKMLEEFEFPAKNANGEAVERSLVEHLLDTHKTKYVVNPILNYLEVMCVAAADIIEERKKQK